jgi:hypothetical protein
MAHAMQMHLYQVLYEGDLPPSPLAKRLAQGKWGSSRKSVRYFLKLTNYLSRMDTTDRLLLLGLAKEVGKASARAAVVVSRRNLITSHCRKATLALRCFFQSCPASSTARNAQSDPSPLKTELEDHPATSSYETQLPRYLRHHSCVFLAFD